MTGTMKYPTLYIGNDTKSDMTETIHCLENGQNKANPNLNPNL